MFLSYGTLLLQKYTDEDLSCGVLPSRQRLLVELYPRALPPVTQGSAFQAPECMWGTCDVTTIPTGQMLHIALCCLEGSTMSNLVHRRRRCARIDPHDSAAWRAVP